jgi:PIN domain nuclease of toxin-antitoxin system
VTYLLDTATWTNSAMRPALLPPRLRKIVGNPREVKGLSSVSLLECAIHHRHGRLQFRGSLHDFFTVGLAHDIELIHITPEIAAATNELPLDFPGRSLRPHDRSHCSDTQSSIDYA